MSTLRKARRRWWQVNCTTTGILGSKGGRHQTMRDGHTSGRSSRSFAELEKTLQMAKSGLQGMTMTFTKLLEPAQIAGMTLRNRLVFPATSTNLSTREGYVTERE